MPRSATAISETEGSLAEHPIRFAHPDGHDLHPIVQAWIHQLLDLNGLVCDRAGTPIEIHLFTANGRVRKAPIVTLNRGASGAIADDVL